MTDLRLPFFKAVYAFAFLVVIPSAARNLLLYRRVLAHLRVVSRLVIPTVSLAKAKHPLFSPKRPPQTRVHHPLRGLIAPRVGYRLREQTTAPLSPPTSFAA